MNPNEVITYILDITLIGGSIWTVIAIRGLGGEIGRSLGTVTAGAVVLGLAHIIETLTFALGILTTEQNEIAHRLIVLTGFALLVIGFNRIGKLK